MASESECGRVRRNGAYTDASMAAAPTWTSATDMPTFGFFSEERIEPTTVTGVAGAFPSSSSWIGVIRGGSVSRPRRSPGFAGGRPPALADNPAAEHQEVGDASAPIVTVASPMPALEIDIEADTSSVEGDVGPAVADVDALVQAPLRLA
jgi:hypothetical protein